MNDGKKKILLIDDEADLCTLVKINLEFDSNYEVEVAYSGEEGVRKAMESEYDLVITDFKMPGMNGEEVVKRLKEMKVPPPIIIFSIYHDDSSTINKKTRERVDGMISKPIDHELLNKIIVKIFNKKTVN